MTRQDLLDALLLERYGKPVPEWKPPRVTCDYAGCDLNATEQQDGWDLCHRHLLHVLRNIRLRSVS